MPLSPTLCDDHADKRVEQLEDVVRSVRAIALNRAYSAKTLLQASYHQERASGELLVANEILSAIDRACIELEIDPFQASTN